MNVFVVPDLRRAIMNILPDIRVLRVCRELNELVVAEPEYTLWQKCAAAGSIYSHGTPKMFTGKPVNDLSLDYAVEYDNMPAVEHLVNDNILCIAARYGRVNIIKQYRADTNCDRDMALIAIVNDHPDVVEYLVDDGLRINVMNRNDAEVVEIACRDGKHEFVEMLIRAGVDVNFVLATAIKYNQKTMIDFAFDRGAGVSGYVIYAACEHEYFEILKLVNPAVGLQAACMAGKLSAAEYFISRGASTVDMLMPAIYGGCLDVVKLATSKGEIPNEGDLTGADILILQNILRSSGMELVLQSSSKDFGISPPGDIAIIEN